MASPEPVRLGEHVLYLPGGVNSAVVHHDGAAVIVDTGLDRDQGRRLHLALERYGLTLTAIVNTHAHADHFGGNDYLLRRHRVPVYAPPFEASLMADPYLEPVYLYHGARPLTELTSKWLQAPPSPVDHALEAGTLELIGLEVTILDTSGHAHRQMSLLVDGVLLAADALFGTSVLERYPIPFGQDVAGQLAAYTTLAGLDAGVALPGHGRHRKDLAALVASNRAAVERVTETVERHAPGRTSEQILAASCHELGVTMTDIPRYHLNLCTVAAHLSYLRSEGRLDVEVEANRLIWIKGRGATRG